jgi:hypothetical protein
MKVLNSFSIPIGSLFFAARSGRFLSRIRAQRPDNFPTVAAVFPARPGT